MFCQKCGTKNPDNGKYCRSCGIDLGNVAEPTGLKIKSNDYYIDRRGRVRSNDPDDLWSAGVRNTVLGIGFLIVSIVLFFTNVAGGNAWWWAMLFPAFSLIASGIGNLSKSKRLERKKMQIPGQPQSSTIYSQPQAGLPPSSADYIQIKNLALAGNKIEAIKIYRETFGVDLKEAKEAVEKISAGQMPLQTQYGLPQEYVKPQDSVYDTGDLTPPPSVTEGTTRHLEMDSEGKTMTLPKEEI